MAHKQAAAVAANLTDKRLARGHKPRVALVDVDEAARRFEITTRQIYRIIHKGRLEVWKAGSNTLISVASIDAEKERRKPRLVRPLAERDGASCDRPYTDDNPNT